MIGGELVREARRRAGLTQKELAERAGTTQSAIARLESGRNSPSFEQVERLLKLCGFSMIVSMATYDDSHLVQAKANLRRTVEERIANNAAGIRFADELREAFERAPTA
jgi:transcriptional regulator with XRE-family HTH domain